MNREQLIHTDGAVPSIFFPPGKPRKGGTCEFSTRKCRSRCPSDCQSTNVERGVLKLFKETPASELVVRLYDELLDGGKLFLQWFAWGDCPRSMTEKIVFLMLELKKKGVVQCGFTRNRPLWNKVCGAIRLALTVEKMSQVEALCAVGVVAVPNYKTGCVSIYRSLHTKTAHKLKHPYSTGECGGGWVTWGETSCTDAPVEALFEQNCILCHKNQRGCFTVTPATREVFEVVDNARGELQ